MPARRRADALSRVAAAAAAAAPLSEAGLAARFRPRLLVLVSADNPAGLTA
jgi:hypothetical protein